MRLLEKGDTGRLGSPKVPEGRTATPWSEDPGYLRYPDSLGSKYHALVQM